MNGACSGTAKRVYEYTPDDSAWSYYEVGKRGIVRSIWGYYRGGRRKGQVIGGGSLGLQNFIYPVRTTFTVPSGGISCSVTPGRIF